MGLFDRLWRPAPRVNDPLFGVLKYQGDSWIGQLRFPATGTDVMIDIGSAGSEPAEPHRALFSELAARYPSLEPSIADSLFLLWAPYRDVPGAHETPPVITSAEQMLHVAALEYVRLALPSNIVLGYGLIPSMEWDDVMLSVNISNWQVSAGSLDD
jgi:hypothetical protein